MNAISWSPLEQDGVFRAIVGRETPIFGLIREGTISIQTIEEYRPTVVDMLLKADTDPAAMTFADAASYKAWMSSVFKK